MYKNKSESNAERVRDAIKAHPDPSMTAAVLSQVTGVAVTRVSQILHREAKRPNGLVYRVGQGVYHRTDPTRPAPMPVRARPSDGDRTASARRRTRLRALAECCHILDALPTAQDRQAVIDALSTMGDDARASEGPA